jgi:hypothetical protein
MQNFAGQVSHHLDVMRAQGDYIRPDHAPQPDPERRIASSNGSHPGVQLRTGRRFRRLNDRFARRNCE